jgi:hypothetical protein
MRPTSAGWIPYLEAPQSVVGMAAILDPTVPRAERQRRATALPKDDDDGLEPSSLSILVNLIV